MPFLQSDNCRLSFSCGLQLLHNALLFEQLVYRQRRPRGSNAKLAVSIDDNQDTGDFYTRDVADKAAVVDVCAQCANSNNIVRSGNAIAGCKAQGCIPRPSAVDECALTNGSIGQPVMLSEKRSTTDGRVLVAGVIVGENQPIAVLLSPVVLKKRAQSSICSVEGPIGVAPKEHPTP